MAVEKRRDAKPVPASLGRNVKSGQFRTGPTTGSRARKDDLVRARIEAPVKNEAEAVLAAIGLTVSDAMRLMLHRVVAERRLPFEPLIPNESTIAAIKASRRDDVVHVGSPKNLMSALDDE